MRIVLSGDSDQETVLKSVLPAHQYLSKPCDTERLKSTVVRACALRELLGDDRLKTVVSQMGSLPSLPSLYTELIASLRSPETSIQKVGEIISRDMGMTAKILQMVNSAFFGLCQHVSSPSQAASLLGLETIKALVLQVQIFSARSALSGPYLERLRKHGIVTGVLAKAIAKGESAERAIIENAFMAGLLHDSGKLVFASKLPRQYVQVMALAKNTTIPLWKVELKTFGTTHAEIGAYLMGLWGLPDAIVEALAFHHRPAKCLGNAFCPLTAVHVANALEQEEDSTDRSKTVPLVDSNYLAKIGLLDRLPAWRNASQEALKRGETDDR